MAKKAISPAEQVFDKLLSLPKTEQNEFWVRVAQSGTWQGTALDFVLYASLFEFRVREAIGAAPPGSEMRRAYEVLAEQVSAASESGGMRQLMLYFMPYPASHFPNKGESPGFGSSETQEQADTGRSTETKQKEWFPPPLTKDEMLEALAAWKIAEARKKFKKAKMPENEKLEQAIIDIFKAGAKQPKEIWSKLKQTGEYAELPLEKVRKLKYKLKKAGRLD
jgi:hypothetical protein